MFDHAAPTSADARPQPDTGPLAWVIAELRTSLAGARSGLEAYVSACALAGTPSPAALASAEHARHVLHEAAGVLDMVGEPMAARQLRVAETLIAGDDPAGRGVDRDVALAVDRALQATLAYLEWRVQGQVVSPVVLFSHYRELQQFAGAERIHPADLWPAPSLRETVLAPLDAHPFAPDDSLRRLFDRFVLLVLQANNAQAAQQLAVLCTGLAKGAPDLHSGTFWMVAGGFCEAVALRLLPMDLYVKRGLSRLLQQFIAIAHGHPEVSEVLWRDMLFFCAQAQLSADADDAPATLAEVRRVYRLHEHPPVDYVQAVVVLGDPLQRAPLQAALQEAQRYWELYTRGHIEGSADVLAAVARLCATLVPLQPPGVQLAQRLAELVRHISSDVAPPAPDLAMEVATAMLCVEAVFSGAVRQASDLERRFGHIEARLQALTTGRTLEPAEPWMQALYRQADESHSLRSLVQELQASLADTERQLEDFLRGDIGPGLQGARQRVDQMHGVMGLLGLDAAQQALRVMAEAIERLAQGLTDGAERDDLLQRLSHNVGGLSFVIDALHHQPHRARDLFVFDAEQRCLRRHDAWLAQTPPDTESDDQSRLQLQLQRVVEALDDGVDVPTLRDQLDALAEQAALADQPAMARAAREAADAVAQDAASGAQALSQLSDLVPMPSQPLPLPDTPADEQADTASGDPDMVAVFLAEAADVLTDAAQALDALRQAAGDVAALTRLRRAFHTLKGSARMVGLSDFGEAAWAVERSLNDALATPEAVPPALIDEVDSAWHRISAWTQTLARSDEQAVDTGAADETPRADTPEPGDDTQMEGTPDGDAVADKTDADADTLAPITDVAELSTPIRNDDTVRQIGPVRVGIRLYNVFLNEADTWSRQLQQALDEWALQPSQPVPAEAAGFAHSLAGSSATLGVEPLADLARRMEAALDKVALAQWSAQTLPPDTSACLCGAAQELRRLLHQFAAGIYREPQPDWLQRLDSLQHELLRPAVRSAEVSDAVPVQPLHDGEWRDEPDADLFPLFEAEAQELMPRLLAVLRQWAARPDNRSAAAEMQRVLHTLKGSARLAGALRWADQVHALETQVQAMSLQASTDDLLWLQNQTDALLQAWQQLSPASSPLELGLPAVVQTLDDEPSAPVAVPVSPSERQGAPDGLVWPQHPTAPGARQARTTLRVATDVLDRLVNEAGEIMIGRTRVQGSLAAARGSLTELSANLERLRLQLRDMELQTETQMQSRLALARDTQQAFDPLEFDRFTRVQEITRSMAESVNDVATVQRQLQRALDGADDQLDAQGRQSRALQRDLLGTRLVEFEAMAERLYRVVRQAAKETGKQVRLDIVGGAIDMDRGMLERLTPAFEHLLRNAVVHGVEAPEVRQAAGKAPEGRIAIELTQLGNDVRMVVSDDGAGLDLAALGARAQALGLSVPQADDTEAWAELVFVPGLSTAASLSALAGRGVGMDVVRSDIVSLGGRVQVHHTPTAGCRIEMVLPLTTAITQVVTMRVGDHVFGVPATLVETVRRFDAATLQQAYAAGHLPEAGEAAPLFWAGALLQQSPAPQQWLARGNTCVWLRSAGQRVALHVDEVMGSQEVVVKKLGPQLSGVPGLAGMSVLGSGAVALIHNPVVLARLHGDRARAYARSALPEATPEPLAAPLSRQPLVLVVDDSITVRRVTQRLLVREGYRVALAADGLQALELLPRETPTAVLCDIEMPRMDGFDLLRNLRGDARWAGVPVIMITSRIADKHRELALSLGANHYLGKPYPEDELLGLLAGYTRSAD